MSIGLGNIIVQNKKEPAGVSDAESGLHMDGSKARLGGQLLENTDIDIDTNTFFLQWDGAAGAFLIDVFNDKYFFGTIDGSFNLETGFTFKENEAAIKLNGNAAVSARGQAGIGAGIVYEIGDVENVNNGTKITITEDTETVEITNIPDIDDYLELAPVFMQGNKIVKAHKANNKLKNFDASFSQKININNETLSYSNYSITGNLLYITFYFSFKVTDNTKICDIVIDISDIFTTEHIESDSNAHSLSCFYSTYNQNGVANATALTDEKTVQIIILPLNNSGDQSNYSGIIISGTIPIYSISTP